MTTNSQEYVWMNGKFMLLDEANISILSHSLHYSGSVFEGIRAHSGKIFKLKEHIRRLFNSASLMNLKVEYTESELINTTEVLIKKNSLSDAYIRPLIWRGNKDLKIDSQSEINIAIIAKNSKLAKTADANLTISKWRKISPNASPVQSKSSMLYAMMRIAKEEAIKQSFDDALMLDYEGFIAENTTSNIFFAQDNVLFTPIADRFLNGITRQTVIKIAQNLGIKIKEVRINIEDLDKYDDCFATGTAIGIKGIASITNHEQKYIFNNKQITDLIRSEYYKLIEQQNV
ncbi:MAG: aminotransferase class IV [Rickettsiaceae bacterium]|nr:aminotransferase class IV [Rickettsiaceae bacterium]